MRGSCRMPAPVTAPMPKNETGLTAETATETPALTPEQLQAALNLLNFQLTALRGGLQQLRIAQLAAAQNATAKSDAAFAAGRAFNAADANLNALGNQFGTGSQQYQAQLIVVANALNAKIAAQAKAEEANEALGRIEIQINQTESEIENVVCQIAYLTVNGHN